MKEDLKRLTLNEKLDILYNIETQKGEDEKQYEVLCKLAYDENKEIRWLAAENLVLFPSEKTENILIDLLNDTNEVVRVNACDSLCIAKSDLAIEKLKNKAVDDTELVRSYAVLSLADIADNNEGKKEAIGDFLKKAYPNEKSEHVLISYFYAFYLFGNEEYYDKLLLMLNNNFYQIRCGVLNLLRELISPETAEKTKTAVNNLLKTEKTIAVKSSADNLLTYISSHFAE